MGTQPTGGNKLEPIQCGVGGSLHVCWIAVAWTYINKTPGDEEEGSMFRSIQNFSGATALLPGSKEVMTGGYKQSH